MDAKSRNQMGFVLEFISQVMRVKGRPGPQKVQALSYAYNVYKGETEVSPFFICYQGSIASSNTTNCKEPLGSA